LRNNEGRTTNDEGVTAALKSYADRGVFRGFRAAPSRGGRVEYRFLWLTRKPTIAVFDPRRHTLRFPSLLPGLDCQTAADLRRIVTSRTDRTQPAHKRLDARRARISSSLQRGDFALRVEIRGRNHSYAVSQALNLINEMFLTLHERHPDYLVAQFNISAE
jgi:hypothetical protein